MAYTTTGTPQYVVVQLYDKTGALRTFDFKKILMIDVHTAADIDTAGGVSGNVKDKLKKYTELSAVGTDFGTTTQPYKQAQRVFANGGADFWVYSPTRGTKASLTTGATASNNAILHKARKAGTPGNSISLTYVIAGNNTPLTVSVAGNAITVNVATGSSGLATSKASEVIKAIQNTQAADDLITVQNATNSSGTGIVPAVGSTNLSSGSNTEVASNLSEALDEVMRLGESGFYFVIDGSYENVTGDTAAIANWVAANKRAYFFGNKVGESVEAFVSRAKSIPTKRAFGIYMSTLDDGTTSKDHLVPAAVVGRISSRDPGQIDPFAKQLEGVPVDDKLTISQVQYLHDNYLQSYRLSFTGRNILTESKTTAGTFFDITRDSDWLVYNIELAIQNFLEQEEKPALDDIGIQALDHKVIEVFEQATDQGVIARNADGSGMYATYPPRRSSLSTTDLLNRHLNNYQAVAVVRGSIHKVTLRLVFTVDEDELAALERAAQAAWGAVDIFTGNEVK